MDRQHGLRTVGIVELPRRDFHTIVGPPRGCAKQMYFIKHRAHLDVREIDSAGITAARGTASPELDDSVNLPWHTVHDVFPHRHCSRKFHEIELGLADVGRKIDGSQFGGKTVKHRDGESGEKRG